GRRAAVREIADDQQVPGLVQAVEARATADAVGAERDLVLEEPEPLLRVAAVIQPIRAEEDDVAGRRTPARAVGARRQGIAGRERVLQVVFVRQAAGSVLPGPLIDVLRILRSATGEDRGVVRGRVRVLEIVRRPRNSLRPARDGCGPTPRHPTAGRLVTDLVPVV